MRRHASHGIVPPPARLHNAWPYGRQVEYAAATHGAVPLPACLARRRCVLALPGVAVRTKWACERTAQSHLLQGAWRQLRCIHATVTRHAPAAHTGAAAGAADLRGRSRRRPQRRSVGACSCPLLPSLRLEPRARSQCFMRAFSYHAHRRICPATNVGDLTATCRCLNRRKSMIVLVGGSGAQSFVLAGPSAPLPLARCGSHCARHRKVQRRLMPMPVPSLCETRPPTAWPAAAPRLAGKDCKSGTRALRPR